MEKDWFFFEKLPLSQVVCEADRSFKPPA